MTNQGGDEIADCRYVLTVPAIDVLHKRSRVPWPSGKARVCKTLIPRFKSGRHLQTSLLKNRQLKRLARFSCRNPTHLCESLVQRTERVDIMSLIGHDSPHYHVQLAHRPHC